MNRLTKGTALVGDLIIDSPTGNTAVRGFLSGTISLDPASIAATTRGTVTFTLTGAASGDAIIMMPPSGLNDDLVFCGADVTAANTVTVYLYNPTAGAINDTASTWRYVWIDLTA
jgi:hypothetical protein